MFRHYSLCESLHLNYQINFVPNWIWREVVTVGALMAALPGTYAPRLLIRDAVRAPRFDRLNRLKASARNWTFSFSPSRLWFLYSEKSKSSRPGARNVLRPRLPNVPAAGNE